MQTSVFNIHNKDVNKIYGVISHVPNGHAIKIHSDFMFDTVEDGICFFYNIGWKYDIKTDTFSPDDDTDTIGYLVRQISPDQCVDVNSYPWVDTDE